MSEPEFDREERSRPHLREGLILLGFAALLVASVLTVVVPELEDEQAPPDAASQPDAGAGP